MPRITRNNELDLWKKSIFSWHDLLRKHDSADISKKKIDHLKLHSQESISRFDRKDYSYFSGNIPLNFHWRAYDELKEKTAFVDIETTGLSKQYDDITMIGLHSCEGTKIFVNGKNMHKFESEIKKYPMIVTFNGRCFDVPFMQHKFPDTDFNKFHADLRFAMKPLGYSGGLKNIERQVGISRDDDLKDIDGFEAVRLWRRYQKGDNQALETLKRYNQADVENLKTLMDMTYPALKDKEFGILNNE